MNNLTLFITGFIQVVLVSVNTWQIAEQKVIDYRYLHILVTGFFISFVWSFNVKGVAFGDIWNRLSYAFGAGIGTIAGVTVAMWFHRKRK